jgi:hypothetical protein
MESKGSLPWSQQLATCPYPAPIVPTPPSHAIPLRYSLYYYPPIYASVLLVVSFLQGFSPTLCTHLLWVTDTKQRNSSTWRSICLTLRWLKYLKIWYTSDKKTRRRCCQRHPDPEQKPPPVAPPVAGDGASQTLFEIIQRPLAVTGRSRHNISLHFKMLLSHMCQCLANLCKWPSAPSTSWSRHTIDHKSVTSRNSCTWRPISHFITTWQDPSQLQYIVSSNTARLQRVFQCVVGSFWKEMTAGVTTLTTRTFET